MSLAPRARYRSAFIEFFSHPRIIAPMSSFLPDPSIPSWINAVTVVALAVITWSYARSAKKQAKAAESQAQAAVKQADAAERQLAILQAQIESRAGTALATLRTNIAELREATYHWFGQMAFWGQLGSPGGVDLLPSEWSFSLEHARKISPELLQELMTLQTSSRSVSRRIEQFTAKKVDYRTDPEAGQIKQSLAEIMRVCDEISNRLKNFT